ncbi:ATP-dependent Clp protease ATP-binding subunit [Erwinia phage Kuerle]|nr:ATP-dependent Clp protease ATP-binding subunit [Erwinia phage Kuerle]
MFLFPQQEKFVRQVGTILETFIESDCEIRPHFHVTGPSGSGKSYLIGKACEEVGVKMIEINAAQLTAEGLSGNSLSKALRPLREHWNMPNVIFVDEFDKLFQTNGEKTENFRSQVQDEFLTCLESKYSSILTDYGKYDPVRIDKSLFIFAGAYSNQKINNISELRDAGMRTEFLGRVPLIFSTVEVTMEDLRKQIKHVGLYQAYKRLRPETKDADAVKGIAKILEQQNKDMNIGIRLLNTAIHLYFMGNV